jgi:hypothetical protein
MPPDPPRRVTVLVHDRAQAEAALQAGRELGWAVVLTSPDVGGGTGVGYWRALEELLGQAIAVDCGEDAGLVLAGLRCGLRSLRFAGPLEVRSKLADIAGQYGGHVLGDLAPPVCKLAPEADARAGLRHHLVGGALGSGMPAV